MQVSARVTRFNREMQINVVETEPDLSLTCHSCLKQVESHLLHMCGDCITCCSCGWCKRCGKVLQLSPCGACGLCRECCSCYACRKCGSTFTHRASLCSECGCCISHNTQHIALTGCCTLHRASNEVVRTKRKVNLAKYIPKYDTVTKNPSPRLLSAEIEICGIKSKCSLLNTALDAWGASVVLDGSLPAGGFEINTHPAGGDYWIAQVKDICGGLSQAKAWVNYKAGCHTHVDARDFDYVTMLRAIRLISCMEWGLFQLVPPFRRTSTYCEFWAMNYLKATHAIDKRMEQEDNERKITLLARSAILKPLYASDEKSVVSRVRKTKSGGTRYRATNIHSWLYRGTLEFRLPLGTIYPDNIINWGLLLGNVLDVAKGRTDAEVKEITKETEQYIAQHQYYNANVVTCGLDKTFTSLSFELVKNLCPTQEVRDWVIAKAKAVKAIQTQENFVEEL